MAHLGSSLELTENKLTLLYIINSAEIPMNNLELTDIVLDCQLMNYFIMQQLLNEMQDDKMILYTKAENRRIYELTENGLETLNLFIGRIPAGRKKRIDEFLLELQPQIKKKVKIISDYVPISENEYVVSLKARENNFNLIDIDITTGSKKDARRICSNWEKNSDKIYMEILNSLLKKRE